VGHSGGAAVALLDAVYLMAQLNVGVGKISVIVFGLSRVGNQALADFVDEGIHVVHIKIREDLIPTLPRMSLGYRLTSGEIHIQDSAAWVSCPGALFFVHRTLLCCVTGSDDMTRPGQPFRGMHRW
jgi:predicted lipase